LIVEDPSWRRDILMAKRATTMQAFRDLFSQQTIWPGDGVAISTISFIITDRAGSTAMAPSSRPSATASTLHPIDPRMHSRRRWRLIRYLPHTR